MLSSGGAHEGRRLDWTMEAELTQLMQTTGAKPRAGATPSPRGADLQLCALIVDDQQTMRRIVRSLLGAIGITRVLEAVNGQEALDLLVQSEGAAVDLIICDLNMPLMDGLSFCNHLRRTEQLRNRRIPVLILTAEHDEMLLEVVRQVGAAGIAHKPISAPELRRHMQNLLGYCID